jgi:hypothetical protein
MKKLLILVGVLVLLLVIGIVAAIMSLDSGIEKAVEEGGSYALKVPVELESVSVSILSGKASLKGLSIANPEGFETPRAVYLGEVALEIKLGSVTSEVIEIPEVRIIKPELTVEGSLKGSNISKLMANIDETMKEMSSGESGEPAEKPTEKPAEEKPAGPEQKYKIGRVLVTDATLKLSAKFMNGRESSATIKKIEIVPGDEPMTMAELLKKVIGDIMKEGAKNPGQIGKMMGGLVINSGLGSVENATEAVKTGTEKATEATKKATEVGKKVTKGITDFFKKRKKED